MNFQESLDYLLSLGFELSVKKFGLENTTILLEALGNPQDNFLKIQIAGTNGKGSTCAFLESICVAAGIRVGLNTSPHLVSITERVRVNGVDISEAEFARIATYVRSVSEKLVDEGAIQALPTYFEHVTAIAQLAFLENKVEVAILETGLGGRFDATTATRAEIVAITPIAMDHVKTLGPTISDIAGEKAAVIRSDTDVVIAKQAKEPMDVLSAKCKAEGVTPVSAESVRVKTIHLTQTQAGIAFEPNGEEVIFSTDQREYPATKLGLAGEHQIENAAIGLLLAEIFENRGFGIAPEIIAKGLGSTIHRGRLELSGGILYDGAHNTAGALVLRNYLTQNVHAPITMIFGAMSGKALGEISKILFPLAEQLILTTPENPRAMPAEEIAEFAWDNLPEESIFVVPDIREALRMGMEFANSGILLVTGSLYLIGEIKALIGEVEVQRRRK